MGGGVVYLLVALELRSPWSRCWPGIRLGHTVAGLATKSLVRVSNEA